MSHGFPKAARLRKRREYVAVQSRGRKIHGRHFVILAVPGGRGRVGITVSKKVGNAVTRNRVKRLVREFVRHARAGGTDANDWLPAEVDAVIVARQSARSLSLAGVTADLMALERRLSSC